MRDETTLILKDPQSTEPYGFDWTDWLAELGPSVTIVTSTWVVSQGDGALTLSDDSVVAGSKHTQVRLSGGTLGKRYLVKNHIITSSGDRDDRSLPVLMQHQ